MCPLLKKLLQPCFFLKLSHHIYFLSLSNFFEKHSFLYFFYAHSISSPLNLSLHLRAPHLLS